MPHLTDASSFFPPHTNKSVELFLPQSLQSKDFRLVVSRFLLCQTKAFRKRLLICMWFVSCGVFGNSQAFNEFNGKDREL